MVLLAALLATLLPALAGFLRLLARIVLLAALLPALTALLVLLATLVLLAALVRIVHLSSPCFLPTENNRLSAASFRRRKPRRAAGLSTSTTVLCEGEGRGASEWQGGSGAVHAKCVPTHVSNHTPADFVRRKI